MKKKLMIAGFAVAMMVGLTGLATAARVLPQGTLTVECAPDNCALQGGAGIFWIHGDGFSGNLVHLDVSQGGVVLTNANASVDNKGVFDAGPFYMSSYSAGSAKVEAYSKAGKNMQLTYSGEFTIN